MALKVVGWPLRDNLHNQACHITIGSYSEKTESRSYIFFLFFFFRVVFEAVKETAFIYFYLISYLKSMFTIVKN